MERLPNSIQREFDAAVERTGMTPQLELAAGRLELLFMLTPEGVENIMRPIYQRLT